MRPDPLAVGVFGAVTVLGLLAVKLEMWALGFWPAPRHIHVDVWGWLGFLRQVRAGQVPFVDFWREYPVGAGLLYWLPSRWLDPDHAYEVLARHAAAMVLVHAALATGVFLMARKHGRGLAVMLGLLTGLLPTAAFIGPFRFDGLVALVTLAAAARHAQGRRLESTALLSLATWVKWYPALFLLAQELGDLRDPARRGQWWRSAVVFVAMAVAVNAPFVVLGLVRHGNADAWLAPYLFHRDRPLFMDTVLGVATAWFGPLAFERWAAPLSGLAAVAVLWLGRERSFAARVTLACIAVLALNRVYSPQFHLWFAPFVALVAAQAGGGGRWNVIGLWVLVDVLNVLVFPTTFDAWDAERNGFPLRVVAGGFGGDTLVFHALVVVRSVVLLLLGSAVWRASRPQALRL